VCCTDCVVPVLRSGPRAHGFLGRLRRSNAGWFEELQRGDLERECLEERCSYEEAREVFEFTKTTVSTWTAGQIPIIYLIYIPHITV
jgi:hypothetical protein